MLHVGLQAYVKSSEQDMSMFKMLRRIGTVGVINKFQRILPSRQEWLLLGTFQQNSSFRKTTSRYLFKPPVTTATCSGIKRHFGPRQGTKARQGISPGLLQPMHIRDASVGSPAHGWDQSNRTIFLHDIFRVLGKPHNIIRQELQTYAAIFPGMSSLWMSRNTARLRSDARTILRQLPGTHQVVFLSMSGIPTWN